MAEAGVKQRGAERVFVVRKVPQGPGEADTLLGAAETAPGRIQRSDTGKEAGVLSKRVSAEG